MTDKFSDFLEFKEFEHEKDYSRLEGGPGFVILDSDECPTCSLHTDCDAAFIALLQFKHDTPRGNHYHLKKEEHMVVMSGTLKCVFAWPPESGNDETYERILEQGQMVVIQPGCVHTFTALNGDVMALEFAPQVFEMADTIQLD